MKEIRRIIMTYAWKLAKKQAIKDNCSARECLSWALTQAWSEYKFCENGICFDIHALCELMDNSKKNEILPLPAVLASLGMLDRKIILRWGRESAHMGDDTEIFFFDTTGNRFRTIEDALNLQRMIYAQCGKMPTLEYAFSGVKGAKK